VSGSGKRVYVDGEGYLEEDRGYLKVDRALGGI